ncbi:iron(III) transport system substrate-binding protein [Natronospira proteinivora]|uniref:Iron(III) transport system substrate-binding protein n=1 Tax=Natronospira proteinivora TaxID=1807133 RepID=A0ABT1GAW8_9GAMM|nr:extracellular solute-binding protein [Natronospira proteinivora]MCP1728474.1 iron(III) transport system substrate-binding protein [Natronospira proteinivora]
MSVRTTAFVAALTCLMALPPLSQSVFADDGEEVVVYSARQEHLIKPLFDRYEAETGVRVRYTTGDAGQLLQRIASEGRRTRADLLLTVDAGNLWQAADRDLLAPVESAMLEDNIPDHLRDPEGQWSGLSLRVRTMVYHPDRVDPEELSSYADLADERWEGRLCLRSSRKVYNQSLVAILIEEHGAERTEEIVRGWVDNLAADPFSSDTQVMEAILAGQCDVGLVNSYYYGRLLDQDSDLPLEIFWANQDENGVHVNISGGGVTRHAGNPEGARALLEWMSEQEAQAMMGRMNFEYPANPDVAPDPLVSSWGTFKQNDINVRQSGARQREAVMLMDRAGYR